MSEQSSLSREDPRPSRSQGRQHRVRGSRQTRSNSSARRPPRVAVISASGGSSELWAKRIEAVLRERNGIACRLTMIGDSGLTKLIKEARSKGAHRIMAVGDAEFVRWIAQAMMGSLMPLAPVLIPGSPPIFGHFAITSADWKGHVEKLLFGRFLKLDMAMGTSLPMVHQLVAGFPVSGGKAEWRPLAALFGTERLKLSVEIDRAQVEGEYWCLVVANADLPADKIRWMPGSNWTDQCLDLMLVSPRSFWQRYRFLRALRRGTHGGLPGVVRFRGRRVTIRSEQPWQYAADGGPCLNAADPLILEAKPEKLRLVVTGDT